MQLLTTHQLAPMLNIARGNVTETLKRHGIAPAEKDGRTFLFSIDDIKRVPSWSGIIENRATEIAAIAIRKARADRGLPRKVKPEVLAIAVGLAKNLYLSSGMPDLRMACEQALKLLVSMAEKREINVEPVDAMAIKIEWFYARWVRRRDESMLGPYHQEGWKELWRQAWKQHDAALTTGTASRINWKMFENAGWAGEGYGFGHMIVLDDRSADVFTTADDGKMLMPNGIYVWDFLTGALLFVEPAREVTTQAYIRAILGAIFLNGLKSAPLVVLENAKAAKSVRIEELISVLYTEEDLNRIWADKNLTKLCNGERGPIFRNVPHIAREFGKAFAERSFGVVKREHDASFSPYTFQGGNRQEAVQLNRNNQPWYFSNNLAHARQAFDKSIPTLESYFVSLYQWSQNEYQERERASLKSWAKEKGLRPCRRDMILYYGGGQSREGIAELPPERLAMAIYAASPRTTNVVLRHPGRVSFMLDGRKINLVSEDLGPELIERTLGIVPVPNKGRHYIVVLLKWQSKRIERYVTIAEDLTAETIEQAIEDRAESRRVREALRGSMDQDIRDAQTAGTRQALQGLKPENRIAPPTHQPWIEELASSDTAEQTIEAEDITEDQFINDGADDDEIASIMNL